MNRPAFALVLLLASMPMSSAFAQWQLTAGGGVRHVQLIETDPNGRQLVQEHGWLPGLELRADYTLRNWRFGASGARYRGSIAYDGQLQSGAQFTSDTGTAQSRIAFDIARRLTDNTRIIGGIEWDRWRRNIDGRGVALGLDERYTSWRLLAGADTRVLQSSDASLDFKALAVVARAERLHVHFENRVFDDTDFSTKPAVGLRLALACVPTAMPNLSASVDIDWIRIRRSDDAPLSRNGAAVGSVAQSAHRRSAIGIHINHRF